MRDEARPAEYLPIAHTRRRWPWVLGGAGLFLAHAGFFLPLRAIVPAPEWVDPWWGVVLVLVDEVVGVLLISQWVTKLRSRITARKDGDGEPD